MYSKLNAKKRVSRCDLFILQHSLTIIENTVSYTTLNENKSIGLTPSTSERVEYREITTRATCHQSENCKKKGIHQNKTEMEITQVMLTLEVPLLTCTLDSHKHVLEAL
jgi:hypothetical protein